MDRILKQRIREAIDAEKHAKDWKALGMIKRKPGVTRDPTIDAWYDQNGAECKVAKRVYELLDVYRMNEEEVDCLLRCMTYHSNRFNMHPIN